MLGVVRLGLGVVVAGVGVVCEVPTPLVPVVLGVVPARPAPVVGGVLVPGEPAGGGTVLLVPVPAVYGVVPAAGEYGAVPTLGVVAR